MQTKQQQIIIMKKKLYEKEPPGKTGTVIKLKMTQNQTPNWNHFWNTKCF